MAMQVITVEMRQTLEKEFLRVDVRERAKAKSRKVESQGARVRESTMAHHARQVPRVPVLNRTRQACPTRTSEPATGSPSGDQSAVEPPGPIPNPEVKRRSANGSGTIGPVRVGRRQVFARLQLKLEPGSFFAHGPDLT